MSNARFAILQATAVKDKRINDSQFRTLAALGMYADKNGWCWPSLKTLSVDLGKCYQAIGRDTIALRKLGYLETKGRFNEKTGARQTNLYRLIFDFQEPILPVGEAPSPSEGEAPSPSEGEAPSLADVEQNVPFNEPINVRSNRTDVQKRGDLVDGIIELSQASGVKKSIRIDNLEEIIHKRFNISPTRRGWKDFLEFVDKRQQEQAQMLPEFLDWMTATPKFDISFWGPLRMQENWDRAFVSNHSVKIDSDGGFYV